MAVMDQHRDTLGTDRQPNQIQLHKNFDELHKTISRLHALQVDYRKLIERARENLRDAQTLEEELHGFVPKASPHTAD